MARGIDRQVKCSVCDTRRPIREMLRYSLKWACSGPCVDALRQEQLRKIDEHERSLPRRHRSSRARDIPTGVRNKVLRRDGGRCRWCRGVPVQLHHVFYRSQGIDHQPHNLLALCSACHVHAHSDKKKWQPVLLAVLWTQYVEGTFVSVPQMEKRLRREAPRQEAN